MVLTIYHPGYDSEIWTRSVYKLAWPKGQRESPVPRDSRPPTNFILSPKPQRAIPPAVYATRSNHEFDYGMDAPPVPADDRYTQPLPSDSMNPQFPPLTGTWQEPTQPSLYPSHIQSALQPLRAPHPVHTHGHRPQLPPFPSPLGNWPRQNPTTHSSSRRRYPLPPVADEHGQSPQAGGVGPSTSPPRQRPLGPRTLELAR